VILPGSPFGTCQAGPFNVDLRDNTALCGILVRMSVLALSATSTTGLFTLVGAVVGAAIGGGLTLALEILRRRWHREDETGTWQKERLAAIEKERKPLYTQLLAKGIEFKYTIDLTRISEKANPFLAKWESSPGQDILVHEIMSRINELSGTNLREMESLCAQVQLIAGAEVSRLTKEWDVYLSHALSKAMILGQKPEKEDPYDSLVKAMKEELGYNLLLHVKNELGTSGARTGAQPR